MASRLVLVHSPLAAPMTWEPLGEVIAQRGYEISRPDLRDAVSGGPPYWSRIVETVARSAATGPATLVAHSGAGPLLPAMGQALGQIDSYVFVDARLPHPGQSWVETAPPELVDQLREMARDGWLPPWSAWWGDEVLAWLLPDQTMREVFSASCPPLPIAMFEEALPAPPGWPDAPCGYLLLSDAYLASADLARSQGWPVVELSSNHLGVLTNPVPVADALIHLIEQLRQ